MKSFLFLGAAVFFVASTAGAQNTPVAPAQQQTLPPTSTTPLASVPLPTAKELEDALSLVRTANLWNKPFDWKETGSTTEDVVAHARKLLGDEAPTIEIRGKDESRSTFTLQQALLGSVLCSLAELTDRRVWIFPGRIVLASPDMLTEAEQSAIKNKNATVWTQDSWNSTWGPSEKLEELTVPTVAADVKQRLAAKGQIAPLPAPPTRTPGVYFSSYELPLGELSPASQKALQDLINTSTRSYAPPVPVTSGVLVCLDESNENLDSLFFKEPRVEKPLLRYFHWSAIRLKNPSPTQ